MQKLLSYLSFQGRANRQRFWLTTLAIWAVTFVGILVCMAIIGLAPILGVLFLPLFLAVFVAALANSTRRLHDRNKSAWWLVLFVGVPFLFSLPADLMSTSSDPAAQGGGALLALLGLPFSIWAFVELGCLKGTAGPNRFGEDPLGQTATAAFA